MADTEYYWNQGQMRLRSYCSSQSMTNCMASMWQGSGDHDDG